MIQSKPSDAKSTICFTAKLTQPASTEKRDTWTALDLPKSASAKLPSRATTIVEGIVNGLPFRAALDPSGSGHRLKFSSALRRAVGADALDKVRVEITRTKEETEIRVPSDLRKALAASPRARAMWADITPTARREWILWLCTTRYSETRKQRIEKACDMLASGKRRVCCFGGLNWLTKDYPKSVEKWLPLPD